jgi:hypothetical protein
MNSPQLPVQVTLVATPDTQVAPLSGLYEALNSFPLLGGLEEDLPQHPFDVQIAAPSPSDYFGASGLPLGAHRACDDIEHTPTSPSSRS